jgi:hypothetical protein
MVERNLLSQSARHDAKTHFQRDGFGPTYMDGQLCHCEHVSSVKSSFKAIQSQQTTHFLPADGEPAT